MPLLEKSLETWRGLRQHAPILAAAQRLLREPLYRALEGVYRNGAPAKLPDGVDVRLHPRLLGMRPELYEADLAKLIAPHLRPGGVVLDIGAHVGLHAIMFSHGVGPNGRVLAVEPSPANARMLRTHLAWNGCRNVEVIEAAVGDREGEVRFCYEADPSREGGFANSLAYDLGTASATVRMTTLDALAQGMAPDLVKIDIEGAELLALRGGKRLLARARPVVVVAIHPGPMRTLGTTPVELIEFMRCLGYQGRHLDGRPASDAGGEEIIFEKRTGP